MFEFIKSLFKRKPTNTEEESKCPFLVHADISESIVIKEVALADVKPKTRKPKVAKLKEVKPAKKVDNVVPLVQPTAAKPKKPAKPKRVEVKEDFNLSLVVTPPKPKGRPKKTSTKKDTV